MEGKFFLVILNVHRSNSFPSVTLINGIRPHHTSNVRSVKCLSEIRATLKETKHYMSYIIAPLNMISSVASVLYTIGELFLSS